MEVTFFTSLITLLTVFFLLALTRQFTRLIKSIAFSKMPPGPWKLPLIGSMHHFFGVSRSLPHHAFRALSQKYGAVMHLQLGEISTVIISSPQAAKEVLKIYDLRFAYRPEFLASEIVGYDSSGIAFAPYGDYWKQMRKICILELLSPKNVSSFGTIREDEAWKIIESIKSTKSPINLTQHIFSYTNNVVCRAAFGKSFKDQDLLISLIKEAILIGGGFDIADLFPSLKFLHFLSDLETKLLKLHQQIDQVLNNVIEEHKEKLAGRELFSGTESWEEDLVDVLLRLKERGNLEIPISTKSIKAVIWDVFAAGTETSATTLDFAMAEMIRNPQVMEKAQAEVREILKGKKTIQEADLKALYYLKLVIKETLRLHPPLPLLLPRECREECNVGGYHIPVKTKVIINAWAINRDPRVWKNPENFEPERFDGSGIVSPGMDFEYIPFGGGRRICPGISFGMASVELILAQLLYHFDWKLPSDMRPENLDMTETMGATSRRKNSLFLTAALYNQPSCGKKLEINSPCVPSRIDGGS